ncbi:ATP-binding protein, partial [Actinocrinis puniceicyclus]
TQTVPPGRAYRAETGIELQAALLDPDPTGQAQNKALARIAERARERTGPDAPALLRVDPLPASLTYTQARALHTSTGVKTGPLWGLIGVGGDETRAYGVDLSAGSPAMLIAGPPRSGRSTAALTLAQFYLQRRTEIIVVAPRPSPLRGLEGRAGVLALLTSSQVTAEQLTAAFNRRTKKRLVVILDDAQDLRNCDAGTLLSDTLNRTAGDGIGLVIAGDPEELSTGFSGWLVDARKARRGLLLSPRSTTDGQLTGIQLTRGDTQKPVKPGIGILHTGDGKPVTILVPHTTT